MRKIAVETLIWSAAISATALAAPTAKNTASKAAKPSAKPVAAKATTKTTKPVNKPAPAKAKPTKATPIKPLVVSEAPKEAAPATGPIYQNDLQKFQPGKLPDEFMVLGGEFSIVKDGDNVMIELPAEPIDAFGLLFGPTAKEENAMASARVFGTKKGRRAPSFGVGVFGISGYKLRVSPAAKKLEILKDEDTKAEIPFEWQSETWTRLKISARPLDKGQWKVEGRVWQDGEKEPEAAQIEWTDAETPPAGRASLIGAPYAGTPLRFDDLAADKTKK